jgi:hypothetical protein
MRTHLQGFLIIGLVAVALLGLTRLASPALSEAFGDEGAVRAESFDEELVELTLAGDPIDDELTNEEVTRLQFQLLLAGFLEHESDVDGVLGPTTETAAEQAAEEWALADARLRTVLTHADELYADHPFFDAP